MLINYSYALILKSYQRLLNVFCTVEIRDTTHKKLDILVRFLNAIQKTWKKFCFELVLLDFVETGSFHLAVRKCGHVKTSDAHCTVVNCFGKNKFRFFYNQFCILFTNLKNSNWLASRAEVINSWRWLCNIKKKFSLLNLEPFDGCSLS